MSDIEKACKPEDLTALFVERSNNGDAAGVAALYEEDAVMAYPPGSQTVGRDGIRLLWEKVLASAPRFEQEPPLPTLISGDIALPPPHPKMVRAPAHRLLAANLTAPGCVCLTNPSSSHPPADRHLMHNSVRESVWIRNSRWHPNPTGHPRLEHRRRGLPHRTVASLSWRHERRHAPHARTTCQRRFLRCQYRSMASR
jgi:SnoaL-like domain